MRTSYSLIPIDQITFGTLCSFVKDNKRYPAIVIGYGVNEDKEFRHRIAYFTKSGRKSIKGWWIIKNTESTLMIETPIKKFDYNSLKMIELSSNRHYKNVGNRKIVSFGEVLPNLIRAWAIGKDAFGKPIFCKSGYEQDKVVLCNRVYTSFNNAGSCVMILGGVSTHSSSNPLVAVSIPRGQSLEFLKNEVREKLDIARRSVQEIFKQFPDLEKGDLSSPTFLFPEKTLYKTILFQYTELIDLEKSFFPKDKTFVTYYHALMGLSLDKIIKRTINNGFIYRYPYKVWLYTSFYEKYRNSFKELFCACHAYHLRKDEDKRFWVTLKTVITPSAMDLLSI